MADRNTNLDYEMMQQALDSALLAEGWTTPNPLVGAVVCQSGQVVATGYHARCGEAHAERIALDQAGEAARGGTLYVTLEPCCHHGRTPPCVERVLESGVSRVVIGMVDPNPLVAGQSIERLKAAGVSVEVGVLENEVRRINQPFLSAVLRQRPWMVAKYAMTLDGKMATSVGHSQWISGPESRGLVHDLRARFSAIMVGYRTALLDNPSLNSRRPHAPEPHQPVRIVMGGEASLPGELELAKTAREQPVWHLVADSKRFLSQPADGVREIPVAVNPESGAFDLTALMEILHVEGIDGVLVEGGSVLLGRLESAELLDEIYCFVAPKVLNDRAANSPFAGDKPKRSISESRCLSESHVHQIGDDALIHGYYQLL